MSFSRGGNLCYLGVRPTPHPLLSPKGSGRERNCGCEVGRRGMLQSYCIILCYFFIMCPCPCDVFFHMLDALHPRKQTWNLKISLWKRKNIDPNHQFLRVPCFWGCIRPIMPANSQIIVCSLHGCILGAESCPPSRRLLSTFHVNPCCATRAALNARNIIYI